MLLLVDGGVDVLKREAEKGSAALIETPLQGAPEKLGACFLRLGEPAWESWAAVRSPTPYFYAI